MCGRIGTLAVVTLAITARTMGGEAAAVEPERYRVEAVGIPEGDLSGALGPRCSAPSGQAGTKKCYPGLNQPDFLSFTSTRSGTRA